jgi:hypothetical protein
MKTNIIFGIILIFLIAKAISYDEIKTHHLLKANSSYQENIPPNRKLYFKSDPPLENLREHKLISFSQPLSKFETAVITNYEKSNMTILITNHANFDIVLYITHREVSDTYIFLESVVIPLYFIIFITLLILLCIIILAGAVGLLVNLLMVAIDKIKPSVPHSLYFIISLCIAAYALYVI